MEQNKNSVPSNFIDEFANEFDELRKKYKLKLVIDRDNVSYFEDEDTGSWELYDFADELV